MNHSNIFYKASEGNPGALHVLLEIVLHNKEERYLEIIQFLLDKKYIGSLLWTKWKEYDKDYKKFELFLNQLHL